METYKAPKETLNYLYDSYFHIVSSELVSPAMMYFVLSLMVASIFCVGAYPLHAGDRTFSGLSLEAAKNGWLHDMNGENIIGASSIDVYSTKEDVDEHNSIVSRNVRQKLKSIVLGKGNTNESSSNRPLEDDQGNLNSYKESPRLQGSISELTKEDVINFIHQQPNYSVDCSADLGELGIMGIWKSKEGEAIPEPAIEEAVDLIMDSQEFISRYRMPVLVVLETQDVSLKNGDRYHLFWKPE